MRNALRLSVPSLPHLLSWSLSSDVLTDAQRLRASFSISHCFFAPSLLHSYSRARSSFCSLSFFRSRPLSCSFTPIRSHRQHTFASDQVLAFLTIVRRARSDGARASSFGSARTSALPDRREAARHHPGRALSANQERSADLRNGGREKGMPWFSEEDAAVGPGGEATATRRPAPCDADRETATRGGQSRIAQIALATS